MIFLDKELEKRKHIGNRRSLPKITHGIDFLSNDYLGVAKLNKNIKPNLSSGSTGSRLLSGNSEEVERLEQRIAKVHGVESALFYSTGYMANLGLLSCIASRHDTLILDEHAHASIIDGARLSLAKTFKFRHHDLSDLETKLKNANGQTFVVSESIFSMDGSQADLKSLSEICKKYGAVFIVDEAHSNGINAWKNHFADIRILTYGKAFGAHGAAVLGGEKLKEFLINFSRAFMYSTAPSPHSVEIINSVYDILLKDNSQIDKLAENITYWNSQKPSNFNWRVSETHIQCLLIKGNSEVTSLASYLQENGVQALGIKSPTVKPGDERIRFCLHSYNTKSEIDKLFNLLTAWEEK